MYLHRIMVGGLVGGIVGSIILCCVCCCCCVAASIYFENQQKARHKRPKSPPATVGVPQKAPVKQQKAPVKPVATVHIVESALPDYASVVADK